MNQISTLWENANFALSSWTLDVTVVWEIIWAVARRDWRFALERPLCQGGQHDIIEVFHNTFVFPETLG